MGVTLVRRAGGRDAVGGGAAEGAVLRDSCVRDRSAEATMRENRVEELMNSRFMGRLLQVDLTSRDHVYTELGSDLLDAYIGGRGLGARLLLDYLPEGADPLGPENLLLFLTGPLTGSPFPGAGKFVVVTKSPATRGFFDSHSSGLLAPVLRFAGYDVLLIKGRASSPSYLLVEDDKVEVRSAAELWGLDAFAAETQLRDIYGRRNVGVAVIGPAGENLVKFASIGSDYYRHAARGGVGSVMGSKNLKAIVVCGTGEVPVNDPRWVIKLQEAQIRKVRNSTSAQARVKYGTPSTFTIVNAAGMLPTRNFQQGTFPPARNSIDGEGILSITVGHAGCYGCIMPCSRLTEVSRDRRYMRIEGPEYETLAMLGSNLGISDPGIIVQANLLCDRLGLDVISAGGVLAFAMECVERGLLTNASVSDLRFGNGEAALRVLENIAYRRGVGDLLAEGVREIASQVGGNSEDFAMHVKGLELPAYDPRAGFGTGLTYAVTPRGGCHRRAWPPAREVLGDVPPYTVEGKAQMVKEMFDERAILHSLVVCDFHTSALPIPMTQYAEFVTAVTGQEYSMDDWSRAADRIETTIRVLNVQEGLTRIDDTLPPRLLDEPLPDGPAKGQLFGREGLDTMLDEYYSLRGWGRQGMPLPETLDRYDIPVTRGRSGS